MDFGLPEEEKILVKDIKNFMKREVTPIIEEYEEGRELPPLALIKKLIPFGYIGGPLAEEEGGHDISYSLYGILMEELGKTWCSLQVIIMSINSVLSNISRFGTKYQKEIFIPLLLSGEKIVFIAITEPYVGSDIKGIETYAVLDGKNYIINGTKTLITNGSVADFGILFATTNKNKGEKGISAFIVEKNISEYSTNNIKKMGLYSSVLSDISLSNSIIPRENLLGQEGEGYRIGLETVNNARFITSCTLVGVAQAAIDASLKYAKTRYQFGKQIGSFQLVQQLIVDMIVETEAARFLSYRVGCLLDKGKKCNKEASMAKLFSSRIALDVALKAIQIHGGYGYTEDYPLVRYYRDIRHLAMADGTSEIQTLIIGRDVLGISAFN